MPATTAINLRDIPDAVQAYLDNEVKVKIKEIRPASGNSIGPGEDFEVEVEVKNANAATGLALTKLKYRLEVANPSVAKLEVPGSAYIITTDLEGNRIGGEVGSMIVWNQLADTLAPGEIKTMVFNGTAGTSNSGGNTSIRARVLADINLDSLFPAGEDTVEVSKALTVVG
jgi:hypothetical protein